MPIKPVIPVPGPLVYRSAERTQCDHEVNGVALLVGGSLLLMAIFAFGVILSLVGLMFLAAWGLRVAHARFRRWRRSRMR
jgi:hypothetical protein